MMVHNLFLCLLASPLYFVNGIPNSPQSLGFEDSERRLPQGSNEVACSNPEELFYNIFFTLNDPSEQATANCTDNDYIVMGLLIQDIVKQIDQDFPKYSNEFIDTSVCAVPAWMFEPDPGNTTGRALLEMVGEWTHRRLNTYTYAAGGRCRRCTSGRRALLEEVDNDYVQRSLPETYPHTSGGKCRLCQKSGGPADASTARYSAGSASEAADAACGEASTAKSALSVCQRGDESCRAVLNDTVVLLNGHKGLPKSAKDSGKIVQVKCSLIADSFKIAKSASSRADTACTKAKEQAALLNKTAALNEMILADDASKIAGDTAMKVQSLYKEAKQAKHSIMKAIMLMDFAVRDQRLKKLLADEEKEYLSVTRSIESEIQKIEKSLASLAKDDKEKARLRAEALEETLVLVLRRRRHAELQKAVSSWTAEVTSANDFAKLMDTYKYELTTALDVDEWLERYRNLLQDAVPKFLYDTYNTTGGGCLDPLFEDKFTADVELVEVASRNETLSKKCESPVFNTSMP